MLIKIHWALNKSLKLKIVDDYFVGYKKRELNENTNGLLRQYFPKGKDFTEITDIQIVAAQERLNHRLRKSLGYKTPFEVFFGTIAKEIAL